jgi:HAE1 family hydrophobic/amphiphilic exporter-1
VITSSLLTLVVVSVIYCYLDDLSNWLKRRLLPRPPATGQAAGIAPAE